ncbi:hypothetical protein LTR16_000481 [Cryomyces antarcticus]|uniref:Uncharacterized protein n=1 Tax=Cryomyces antarcticus TaxID=329879 RepID=A0ABR0M076_9PEZI|nr:hypothetical protein LTR39_000332 [Cryomyces antarcticus]KAK5021011.1 hypothetical protein LTR60_000158 [Cryomyces antarcticus]KAK5257496.1 hypothetical protein LTR16_000481 [Cryomyces antarcticus]
MPLYTVLCPAHITIFATPAPRDALTTTTTVLHNAASLPAKDVSVLMSDFVRQALAGSERGAWLSRGDEAPPKYEDTCSAGIVEAPQSSAYATDALARVSAPVQGKEKRQGVATQNGTQRELWVSRDDEAPPHFEDGDDERVADGDGESPSEREEIAVAVAGKL